MMLRIRSSVGGIYGRVITRPIFAFITMRMRRASRAVELGPICVFIASTRYKRYVPGSIATVELPLHPWGKRVGVRGVTH